MKLSAPTNAVWGVALALGVIGIIAKWAPIPFVHDYYDYFIMAGFAILALACWLKGL